MLNRLGRLLICVYVFAVAGGHWGVMQLTAWSNMAAESESGSLVDALFSTPCEDCLAVLEGAHEEKEDPGSVANAKGSPLICEPGRAVELFPPVVAFELDDRPVPLDGISQPPAIGPPRAC